MKKIDVYGIGNALVDVEFEITDAELTKHNIPKSVMTLIDEPTHDKIVKSLLNGSDHSKTCGGSAANTILTLQQLGAHTFFSCRVGKDEYGDVFHRDLVSHGVQTNLKANHRNGTTGKCIVLITPDAERTMNTFLGASFEFSQQDLSEGALKKSNYLYIEGYLVAAPLGYKAAISAYQMALKHDVKIAISLSDPNMVTYFKDRLFELSNKKVDLLFCNEKEALLFTHMDDVKDAKEILKNYAHTFVITLGKNGALVFDGQTVQHAPANEVKVIDTTGAGDVFAGTFLYAIIKGKSYLEATRLANFAASRVVSKFGPRLNDRQIAEVSTSIEAAGERVGLRHKK